MMKLSDQTLEVLKNFSDINTNILVKPGSELSTISTMKNILAKATITESFDKQFAVYDLSELCHRFVLYARSLRCRLHLLKMWLATGRSSGADCFGFLF